MKLRIRDNSIRFRLGQSEVARLIATGRIEATLEFAGGGALGYGLILDNQARSVTASLKNEAIEVVIPRSQAVNWANGDDVALSATNAAGPAILIEKDFRCLHKDESLGDAYPNPLLP